MMTILLIVLGVFILITTHIESTSDNSILSEKNLKKFKITLVAGYILGICTIICGIGFLLYR